MVKKTDHKKCLKKLEDFQCAEKDARRMARESFTFLYEEGGQWDEKASRVFNERPKYQMDHVYPIVGGIANDLQEIEFGIKVVEAGNGAKSEIAHTYDDMIRSIQNVSGFDLIVADTTDGIAACGFDAWLVTTDWTDVDAFEQDIVLERIEDALNRVWIGPTTKPDFSDLEEAFVITRISREEYEDRFPKGTMQGIDDGDREGEYEEFDKPEAEDIAIADYYYIKRNKVTLHLLSDDRVVRDDQYQPMAAELEASGVHIVRSREREIPVCYVRTLDGGGFLDEPKETPFGYVPVIPVMANYRYSGGRRTYFGVVEKLKDPQRIYNYTASREVSDGALAPVEKLAMTPGQGEGHEDQNSKLNNSVDPVFYYNPDPEAPAVPFKMPGNQPNMGLQQTRMNAAQDMVTTSGAFAPARGEGLSDHSGVAYEMLQNKSNLSAMPYIKAVKRAVRLAGKIIIDAIPKVYDSRDRQVRLINEEGASKFESVNQEVYDQNTGQMIMMRDLSQGHYDVYVTTGRSFASRKTEGLNAMVKMAQVYPALLEMGGDVFAKSLDAPFVNQVAERIREDMIRKGMIPTTQLTEEEKAKIQEEMQNQQPDPMQEATVAMIAAETEKAMMEAKAKQVDMEAKMASIEEKRAKMELAMAEQMRKSEETQAKIMEMYSQVVKNLTVDPADINLAGNDAESAAKRVTRSID